MTALSRALTAARKSREGFVWTQRELEAWAGLPRGTVAQYEQATRVPRLEALIRIADALGLTLDELVGRNTTTTR